MSKAQIILVMFFVDYIVSTEGERSIWRQFFISYRKYRQILSGFSGLSNGGSAVVVSLIVIE